MELSTEELGDETLRELRRIVHCIFQQSRSVSKEANLSVPKLLCLKAIGEITAPEVTSAMVSRAVKLTPATVSRLIDRLEAAGLVVRERRSKDRRKVCLSLTESGRATYESLPTPLQETFLERFSRLDEADRRRLLGALKEVSELLGASSFDAAPLLMPGVDLRHPDAWK